MAALERIDAAAPVVNVPRLNILVTYPPVTNPGDISTVAIIIPYVDDAEIVPSAIVALTAIVKLVVGLNLTIPLPAKLVTGPTKNDVDGIVPLASCGAVGFIDQTIHQVPVPVFIAGVAAGKVVILANVTVPFIGCVHPTAGKLIRKLELEELYEDQLPAIVAAEG